MLSDLINNQIFHHVRIIFLQMKQVKYIPDTATCMRMIVTDAGGAVNSCLAERERVVHLPDHPSRSPPPTLLLCLSIISDLFTARLNRP